MKFNKRLLLIMNELGISQAELARRVNLSNATISNMLKGESSPNFQNVEKIINALERKHSLFLIFGEKESNEVNEEQVEYQTNGIGNLKKEVTELKRRVDDLEKWKQKVTEK